MTRRHPPLLFAIPLILSFGCDSVPAIAERTPEEPRREAEELANLQSPAEAARQHATFDAYWRRGLAELTRFELTQSRYGEPREGEAVTIFVVEPFLRERQVKYEGHAEDEERVDVLKLNAYRRFYTGIYPYTVMVSTFDPLPPELSSPIKVSASVQEWCGNTYMQLNRRDEGYATTLHSYFEQEADRRGALPDVILEDGLWTALRIDVETIPLGEHEVVPGTHHLRFAHLETRAHAARIALSTGRHPEGAGREVRTLSVTYPTIGRTLEIHFEAEFPRAIVGFEETQQHGDETLRTVGRRTNAILTDYWNHNGSGDDAYRRALGLEM